MGKNVDEMSTEEMEAEVGVEIKGVIRKKVVEERLYEKYKNVGKR